MQTTITHSSQSKLQPEVSAEDFIIALEAVMEKETVTIDSNDETPFEESEEHKLDLEDQDMSWTFWLKQPTFFEELNTNVQNVQLERSQISEETTSLPQVTETIAQEVIEATIFNHSEKNPLGIVDVQKPVEFEFEDSFSAAKVMNTAISKIEHPFDVEQATTNFKTTNDHTITQTIVESAATETLKTESSQQTVFKEQVEFKIPSKRPHEINRLVENSMEEVQKVNTNSETKTIDMRNLQSLVEKSESESELKFDELGKHIPETEVREIMSVARTVQHPAIEISLPQETPIVAETEWVYKMESLVVDQVETSNDFEKVTTTRLQLTPENLGELEIELTLKNKELSAKLLVEHAETKEWLEQKVAELTTKLSVQDIHVQEFEVIVDQRKLPFTDLSFDENPFFKQQKESTKQKKSIMTKTSSQQEIESHTENRKETNAGRLSIWV